MRPLDGSIQGAEETEKPAQGPRTGTSGEDGAGKQLGPGLQHPGGSGQKLWTGPSGDKASNPGVERSGIHKEEEAARTSSQGTADQEHGTGPKGGEENKATATEARTEGDE